MRVSGVRSARRAATARRCEHRRQRWRATGHGGQHRRNTGGAAGSGGTGATSPGGAPPDTDGTGATSDGGAAGLPAPTAGGDGGAPAATCSDGLLNQDEAEIDCGGTSCPACALNTPPIAVLTVNPGLGWFDGPTPTMFTASAASSTDREDPVGSLTCAWDWNNDGVIDTTGASTSFSTASAGTYTVVVAVTDSGGLVTLASLEVLVYPSADVVVVTTAADESDSGAPPGAPGGTGLSLREAHANTDQVAGKQAILVSAGTRIAMTNATFDAHDATGVDGVGDGASIDGSALKGGKACLTISTSFNRFFGLELANCADRPIFLDGGTYNQVSRSFIHDFGGFIDWQGSLNQFGPDNEVANGPAYAMTVWGPNQTVAFNRFHGFPQGGVVVWAVDDNLLMGNAVYGCGWGLHLTNGADNNVIVHNTVVDNTGDGIQLFPTVGQVVLSNVVADHGGWGILGDEAWFATHDFKDLFGKLRGACSGCRAGPNDPVADPEFIDVAGRDSRLLPTSPLIDRGIDAGYDVNGPAAGRGRFNGSAPNLGAHESP